MRDDNKDIYDIRKQEEGNKLIVRLLSNILMIIVLQESLMMVPDSKNRLEVYTIFIITLCPKSIQL